MTKLFIILLQILFFTLSIYGQETKQLNDYLLKLYFKFPLDSCQNYIYDYCKNQMDFESSKNMYDSTKIDYRFILIKNDFLEYKPESILIEYFYAYNWGVGTNLLKHTQITGLSLNYDEKEKNCKKQFKTIINSLKNLTNKYKNYNLHADAGNIGKGYDFYRNKDDNYPFLSVHLNEKGCLGVNYSIYIAYITPLKE